MCAYVARPGGRFLRLVAAAVGVSRLGFMPSTVGRRLEAIREERARIRSIHCKRPAGRGVPCGVIADDLIGIGRARDAVESV